MTNAKKHKTKIKNGTFSNNMFLRYCHGHLAKILSIVKVVV